MYRPPVPRVVVSANNIVVPSACVCCWGPGEVAVAASKSRSRGVRVVRTTTKAFEFRLCRACNDHQHTEPELIRYLSLAMIATATLCCAGWFVVATLCLPLAVALYQWRTSRAQMGRGSSCESVSEPVALEDFHARELAFRFDSPRYAAAFASANSAAGKNVLSIDMDGSPLVTRGPLSPVRILAPPVVLLVMEAALVLALTSDERGTPTTTIMVPTATPARALPSATTVVPAVDPTAPTRARRPRHRPAPAR